MEPAPQRPMLAGEVARLAGVSKDTLRHYERIGALVPAERTDSGYRMYPPEAVRRVKIIRGALKVGFSLNELAQILSIRESGQAPCRDVRRMAAKHHREVQEKIAALTKLEAQLAKLLEEWDTRLVNTPEGRLAHLMEALAD